jgi:ABC-2 type transport system permease protein
VSFASAAALLVGASVKNRVRRLVKQPRHLVFLLVGGAYVFMVGGSRTFLRSASPRAMDPSHVPPWLAFLVLAYLGFVWLFGADAAVLAFSEAEVEFFFTAPVTRRQLVHYKLVRTLVASLASGAFFAFVLRRGGSPVYATVGFCIGFSTLAFHRVCASMTRMILLEHGFTAIRRRLVTLAVAAAVLVAGAVSIARAAAALPSFDSSDPNAWMDAVSAWTHTHGTVLSWLLFPVAAIARVTAATTGMQFVAALPAALAVLAVHYVWAMSTDVAFEESSAEAAQKLARKVDDLRAGRIGAIPRTPPLFRLGANGPPWVAIFWKNIIAGTRISRRQLVVWAVAFLVFPFALGAAGGHAMRSSLGWIALGIAVFTALLGPHMVRNDLRQDIDQMDILRSYPLRARDTVMGELLAPLAMLTAIEWGLLVVAAGLGLAMGTSATCFAAAGCALILPAITSCVLVLRNLGALWLPSWAGSSAQSIRGIEAFGQRLLVMIGTLVVLAVVMIPAGGVAAGFGFVLWPWLGIGTLPVAGLAAAAVAFAEAYLGVMVAGLAFERFDVVGR